MQEAGMLTQACTPDLKCKLNISSFLALPHLLDCPICTSNSMSIVLLLQMIGDGIGRGWLIYIRMSVGGGGTGSVILIFFLVLLSFVLSCSMSLLAGVQSVIASVSVSLLFSLFSLSLVPLTRSYWCIGIVVYVV